MQRKPQAHAGGGSAFAIALLILAAVIYGLVPSLNKIAVTNAMPPEIAARLGIAGASTRAETAEPDGILADVIPPSETASDGGTENADTPASPPAEESATPDTAIASQGPGATEPGALAPDAMQAAAQPTAQKRGLPPIAYAFWFSLIAAVALIVVGMFTGGLPRLGGPYLRANLVVGTLGIALPFVVLTYTAPHLPANFIPMLLALSPPLTYGLTLALGMDRLRWLSVAGLALGLAAVFLLVGGLPAEGGGMWLLIGALAPLSFAATNVAAAVIRPPAAPSVSMASGMLLGSAVVLAPFMLIRHETYLFSLPLSGAEAATLAISVLMAAFIVLFFEIIHMAGPVFFSQFNYVVLVTGALWPAFLLGERVTVSLAIAAGVMLVGLLMVNAGTRGESKTG